MLTQSQVEGFESFGFVRIPAAFSRVQAAAMEDRVWRALEEKNGVTRNDRSTWSVTQAVGLQDLKAEAVFEPIGGPATVGAIDVLLGNGKWRHPGQWGQFLVNFPEPGRAWIVPADLWHVDFAYDQPPDTLFGLLAFSFLADVKPRSGGTAVIAGSHHLLRAFVRSQPAAVLAKMKTARKHLLEGSAWLQALSSDADDPDRNARYLEQEHEVDGFRLRVTELTGEAGDVVLCHPWLLHTPAPNCGETPRMMRIQRVYATL